MSPGRHREIFGWVKTHKARAFTIFALVNVAAFVAALRIGGVAPRTDTIPIRVSAVVQLQTVGSRGNPPGSFTAFKKRRAKTFSQRNKETFSFLLMKVKVKI